MEKNKLNFFHSLIKSPIFYILLGAIIVDLMTKWLLVNFVGEGEKIYLIPNFLFVTLTFNTGGIFGLGNDGSAGARIAFIVVRFILAVGIPIVYAYKGRSIKTRYKVCIALIYAGCIGNLIDGLFYWKNIVGFDGVVDWIGFSFFGFIFNLADSYVTVCVILILIFLIVEEIISLKERNRKGEFTMTPEEYEKKLKEEKNANKDKEKGIHK